MDFSITYVDYEKLTNESIVEFGFCVSGENIEPLKFMIYDPFFNVQYISGELIRNDIVSNVRYWVRFDIDSPDHKEKANARFGFRLVVEKLSGESVYEKKYLTNEKADQLRPGSGKTVWIIGDSNAWTSFGGHEFRYSSIGEYLPVRVSITSLSLNRFLCGDYIALLKGLPIEDQDCLVFYLGEIDFRYTIHKHCNKKNLELSSECKKLVKNYISAIERISAEYSNRIIVMSPNPPMAEGFLGTNSVIEGNITDRIMCFNIFDEMMDRQTKFEYLNWTEHYTEINGIIKTEYLHDGDHHIKKHDIVANELEAKLDVINQSLEKMEKKEITLSVIVPAYKFKNYICECLDSIISQNAGFQFEILVRDDYSGDGTEELLIEKYADTKNLTVFESKENIGGVQNIKFLIEKSRGKYIAYIDGDDYFTDPDKLQKQVDFLESHPDYFMHSTGYRNILSDGTILPSGGRWNIPLKSDLTYTDLLECNMVTFGRVFRNSPGLMREWMLDSPYLDWAFNFQASLMGKIKCEAWSSGIYRHSENGMFSLKTQEQKDADNSYIRSLLAERLIIKNSKITIIDCFANNEIIKIKLKDAIRKIKSTGCDVMLISNTSMEKDIIDMCDFYLYDKRNQLFKKEYTNVVDVDFFNSTGPFIAHNVKPGLQRHGLSVLVNLFNALNTAKSLGYTHFQRIECDDIFGNISLSTMSNVEDMCIKEGKKGLFYLNESPDENNISFHYFYCEIDYFLNSVNKISNEDDYIEYLMRENGNMDFVIAESYVYDNLIKAGRENIIHKSGSHDMNLDFPDTSWNTETSGSNIDEKYNGCLTEIYKTYNSDDTQGTNVIYSYNYSDKPKKISISIYSDSSNYNVEHSCNCKGAWTYTPIPDDVIYIDVYEDDIKLYSQKNENIISYIKFT